GHAEVSHAFVDESRLGHAGGAAGFHTASLVDGDVDDGGAGLHLLHHGASDHVRRASAGHQDGADHNVGGDEGVGDAVFVGKRGDGGEDGKRAVLPLDDLAADGGDLTVGEGIEETTAGDSHVVEGHDGHAGNAAGELGGGGPADFGEQLGAADDFLGRVRD